MNYRLDRRFVLRTVGINLVVAGIAAAAAFLLSSTTALAWIFGVVAVAAVLNAVRVALRPPVLVRLDETGLRVGGRIVSTPVRIRWAEVEGVSADPRRLYVDAGSAGTLSLPLAYVGEAAPAMVREIYDRLNTANGYVRFDPSSP